MRKAFRWRKGTQKHEEGGKNRRCRREASLGARQSREGKDEDEEEEKGKDKDTLVLEAGKTLNL